MKTCIGSCRHDPAHAGRLRPARGGALVVEPDRAGAGVRPPFRLPGRGL